MYCHLLLADKQQLTDAMLSANQDLRVLAMEGAHIYAISFLQLYQILCKRCQLIFLFQGCLIFLLGGGYICYIGTHFHVWCPF